MDQGATSKKRRKLVKKFSSPIKNKETGSEINVRSSAELVRKYVIESNKRIEAMLNNAPETHTRYQHVNMPSTLGAHQGHHNKECTKNEGKNRDEANRKLENENDKEDDIQPSKVNGTRNEAELDASVQDHYDSRKFKNKPCNPALSIDEFLAKQGIHVEGECIAKTMAEDARVNDHISEDDNLEDAHEALGISDCDEDQFMRANHVEGNTKTRQIRGKTTFRHIHARTLEERQEVTFDKRQAVGPTDKIVNDLTNFLGTLGRNLDFISLTYTNWIAAPDDVKKRLWKYAQSKFIIPEESKKWVMDGIRDAWKRYKTNIKKNHFEKYDNTEDMLKNIPPGIPQVQFKQLIAYWSLLSVKALCSANSENRKKQKWRHRMGPINFGRVRVGLRENSDTKEEPTQLDVFVATRTGRKGKELDSETQAVIEKVYDHQNLGETAESAFQTVFGKERPGRVRCFGRTIIATSLKREKEINKIKEQYAKEKESLEAQLKETNEKLQGTNEKLQGLQDLVGLLM